MPTSFPFLKHPSPSLPLYCICLWCSFPSSVCLTFQVYTPISLPPRGFTSHWLCLSTVFFLQSMDHGWHTSYLLVTHMAFLLMRTARGVGCLTYPHICNTALYLAHRELSVHIYLVNKQMTEQIVTNLSFSQSTDQTIRGVWHSGSILRT